MNSWKGASLDDVIASWGYPDEEKNIAGKKLYFWNEEATITIPPTAQTYSNYNAGTDTFFTQTYADMGGNYPRKCTKILEADKNNVIVGWTLRGNACSGFLSNDMARSK